MLTHRVVRFMQGLFNFKPSVRPVPLEAHIQGYPGKFYCPRMASMNKPAYAAIQVSCRVLFYKLNLLTVGKDPSFIDGRLLPHFAVLKTPRYCSEPLGLEVVAN